MKRMETGLFRLFVLAGVFTLSVPSASVFGQFALETETARLRPQGEFEIGMALEFQTSKEGQEFDLPMAIEYGMTDRLEFLLEPVPFVAILPNHGRKARGLGDVEMTLTYLVVDETDWFPALAVAGELKTPTATNRLIGTGKTDGSVLLIASKQFGDLDLHFNFAYTVIGQPPDVSVKNTYELALAGVYTLNDEFDLLAEVLYTTSAQRSGGGGEGDTGASALTAEVSGVELVGAVGVQYHLTCCCDVFATASYDNNSAWLLRFGWTLKF